LDHAEDVLIEMPVARYYDEVVLAGLRLAMIDMDRGLVDRSALMAMANVTEEIVAALAVHDDAGEPGGELNPLRFAGGFKAGDIELADDCTGSVLCIPARGPLDHTIAAMIGQLLTRRGCRVREIDRGAFRRSNGELIDPGDADVVCIVGLFDARAMRRVDMLVAQIRGRFPGLRIVVGVSRGEDGGENLLESLGDVIEHAVKLQNHENE
ncbi:MAG: hypothetical protein JWR77_959, partial [Rhizorhabdus sp.]|nr:hypothetical protein [Rhizorhabdus sp.]